MKYTLTIMIIFSVFTTKVFSQECDDTARARMIKAGISDKTIEEQCGKKNEKEEKSDNTENIDSDEEQKVSENIVSEVKEEKQLIRFAFGGASGTFSFTDSFNTAISGDFDHDLSGGGASLGYYKVNENNLIFGGGFTSFTVSGSNTKSKDAVPGNYTYYSSTYGYFDIDILVTKFHNSFFYGLVGYNFNFSENFSFQPNIRLGSRTLTAEWTEYIEFYSYTNLSIEYSESSSEFGLDIDLPFIFKIDESIEIGANICGCGGDLEYVSGTSTYKFTSINGFNLIVDFKL